MVFVGTIAWLEAPVALGQAGHMLFVIHMIDRPGGGDLRTATTAAHRAFVGQHLDATSNVS